jgi:hypothetical protein
MSARLTSAMLVSALIRRTQAEGGHAAIVHKGDETAGAILLETAERGRTTGLFERQLGIKGYGWQRVGPQDIEDREAFIHYIEKRRSSDPDLWQIELDIPNAERLAAEVSGDG